MPRQTVILRDETVRAHLMADVIKFPRKRVCANAPVCRRPMPAGDHAGFCGQKCAWEFYKREGKVVTGKQGVT